jgi:phospholipase B-like protein
MKRVLTGLAVLALAACAHQGPDVRETVRMDDVRLRGASRRDEAGWIVAHLEGPPDVVGFQHGYLLANEIDDARSMFVRWAPTATGHDWDFFRHTGHELFWPQLTSDERREIEGIAAGARARGKAIDRDDVVAINGWIEIGLYYVPHLEQKKNKAPANCSAFIATGSYTADGGIVMAHNAWIDYAIGERWNVVLDIVPERGHRIFMDSFPGYIHSGDDFALNDAGIMVTETTITQFRGFESAGVPEFARARRAIQFASTIDEWAHAMIDCNNGAYANSWLVGDRKTGEIARLELGLRNTPLTRTKDGFFVGSNFPADEKLRTEETTFDSNDAGNSANARRRRWEQLMQENRGRIDVEAAKRFLADHVDSRDGSTKPSGRTLCGHADLDAQGSPEWEWPPYYPGGASTSKATDSKLAATLSFWGAAGHACGESFRAEPFLSAHSDFAWQKSFLRDMPASPWTLFASSTTP